MGLCCGCWVAQVMRNQRMDSIWEIVLACHMRCCLSAVGPPVGGGPHSAPNCCGGMPKPALSVSRFPLPGSPRLRSVHRNRGPGLPAVRSSCRSVSVWVLGKWLKSWAVLCRQGRPPAGQLSPRPSAAATAARGGRKGPPSVCPCDAQAVGARGGQSVGCQVHLHRELLPLSSPPHPPQSYPVPYNRTTWIGKQRLGWTRPAPPFCPLQLQGDAFPRNFVSISL